MATYSYYILHASLQYRTISNGHGFILTQMNHDLVIPGLPEISSKKPESFISNINQKVEADPSPSTYAPYLLADPSGMTIDVELTIVTEDDKTILGKIRDKMSFLNRILIAETPDKTKIGYSLEFDSGISISAFEKFDFDKIITGKVQKIAQAALRKVAI